MSGRMPAQRAQISKSLSEHCHGCSPLRGCTSLSEAGVEAVVASSQKERHSHFRSLRLTLPTYFGILEKP